MYAQWSKKAYSIKYVSGGGTVPSGNPTSYYYDTPTFKLAAATKEGYTFQGWYTDSAYKNRITKITKGTRKNYKLYAKWKINTYDIVFDGNGATAGTMRSISSCKYNTTYKLPANTFQKMDISLSDGVPDRMAVRLFMEMRHLYRIFHSRTAQR